MMIWPDCVALSAKDDYKDVFNMVYWQPVNHCHLEMKYVFKHHDLQVIYLKF